MLLKTIDSDNINVVSMKFCGYYSRVTPTCDQPTFRPFCPKADILGVIGADFLLSTYYRLLVVVFCRQLVFDCGVAAGWTHHWERWIKNQGDTATVWCAGDHCWPRWRIRWSYHYNCRHQWSDTLCTIPAADEVCMLNENFYPHLFRVLCFLLSPNNTLMYNNSDHLKPIHNFCTCGVKFLQLTRIR